jgi:drug/metabolite transporter (DMT)-like permease
MRVDFFYILMGGGVFISSAAQILLKKSAQKERESAIREYLNRLVITGYLILFAAMCVAIVAYRVVPLKYGAIIESLGYVFVMLLSAAFLKEKITPRKLLGNIIIIAGIVVFSFDLF